MTHANHLSDELLRQIVKEHPESRQQDVETHISECEFCQTRLLDVAADSDWRAEAASNLSGENEFFAKTSPPLVTSTSERVGDAFDLETVDMLLEKILSPPTHPETLGKLGRYEVESVIGCGGMGVVLRGHDHDLQRPVAIKLILPRLSKNGTAKQRFAREARAAAAVLHPNVIAIHGIDETNDVPWFVMPLIVGPSLRQLVEEKGPLPEREIIQIGMQIASGLAAAHSQGLVHRDIKPENILIDNRVNRVVITDFGLARRESEESMTQTGIVAGTLNYMSPEQSLGKNVDARSDLFSLGSLLFYLAAGVVPFQSDTTMGILNKISNANHPDVRSLNPEISATLSAIIDRLLAKQPEQRFQSSVELEKVLTEYINHLNQPTNVSAPKLSEIKQNSNWIRPTNMAFAALGLVLLVSLLIVYWPSGNAPTVTTIESDWANIQETYKISDPETFQEEIYEIDRSFRRVDGSFIQSFWAESNALPSLDEINSDLNRIDKELDFVGDEFK